MTSPFDPSSLPPQLHKTFSTISGRKETYIRHCRLCRLAFVTDIKEQEFHETNCRVKYSKLLKELGEQELTDQLNTLEDKGFLPPIIAESGSCKLRLNIALNRIGARHD